MSTNIEKELKILVSKDDFNTFKHHLDISNQSPRIQHNTYYDTNKQSLKAVGAALRLRQFPTSKRGEWTIKQAINDFESLELNQSIDHLIQEVPDPLSSKWITSDAILSFLSDHQLALGDLHPTYQFTTHRFIKKVAYGEYNLDITSYAGIKDYEIELETDNLALAQDSFYTILKALHIPPRPASKKIARVSQQFNFNLSS